MKIRIWVRVGICLGAAITQAWSPVARAQTYVPSQNDAVPSHFFAGTPAQQAVEVGTAVDRNDESVT
jgi:hypothetical protein